MDPHLIYSINRIVRDVEASVGLDELGPRARSILRLIGEENALGSAPRTGDLIAASGLGTPPTIYASLVELEEAGWIERRPDRNDARARRLHLTARATKTFSRMSRIIAKRLAPEAST